MKSSTKAYSVGSILITAVVQCLPTLILCVTVCFIGYWATDAIKTFAVRSQSEASVCWETNSASHVGYESNEHELKAGDKINMGNPGDTEQR